MFKKTIKMCAELDLRNYSVEALRKIKKITKCAVVIVPSDASEAWYDAFGCIEIKLCASIVRVGMNEIIKRANGITSINDSNVDDKFGLYYIKGIGIIETREKSPKIFISGMCIERKNACFDLANLNGVSFVIDDNVEYKLYSDSANIDSDTLKHLNNDTVIIAGNEINIDSNVTEEMLSQKSIKFIAGNNVVCNKEIYGYVNANSQVGNEIKIKNAR